MLKVFSRKSNDLSYFTDDQALELEGLRSTPGWWLRGSGDLTSPQTLREVLRSSERASVVGYDIVVAAPRTTSLLVALDEGQAPGVIAAHRRSVEAAVHYLEEHAVTVRDRRGGDDRDVAARWESIASFTHGINRHGEPHLHDHVIVGSRPEGVSGVLDSRALFAHLGAADAVYRASLRYEVGQRTTWQPWRDFRGVEHVRSLDEGYRTLWGGGFEERGEKLQPTREQVVAWWHRDLERFEPQGEKQCPALGNELNEHTFQAAFEGRYSTTRRDVVTAWADAAVSGQRYENLRATLNYFYGPGDERGIYEEARSIVDVRMVRDVARRGPRPLLPEHVGDWIQRERSRSLERSSTERNLRSR